MGFRAGCILLRLGKLFGGQVRRRPRDELDKIDSTDWPRFARGGVEALMRSKGSPVDSRE